MAIQITGNFEPAGDFPLVNAKDVVMPNGTRLSECEGLQGKDGIPEFDLGSMGMSAVTLPQSNSQIAGDMSAIVSALGKGAVKFVIPVSMGGAKIDVTLTMQGFTDGTDYHQCISLLSQYTTFIVLVDVTNSRVQVTVAPVVTALGFPIVSEADNNKIMQIVNGAWAAVPVADSSVKTYVDEYIGSALEGDY